MVDYYSCDSILAEDEAVPVSFNFELEDLGRVFLENGESQIQKESRMDLPFWLTKSLAEKGVVNPRPPKCYSDRVKRQLLADPAKYNLRKRCHHFYELGLMIHNLDRGDYLAEFLVNCFRGRYCELLAGAFDLSIDQLHYAKAVMTDEERVIVDAGTKSMHAFHSYFNDIQTARSKIGHKRKRDILVPITNQIK